MEQGRKRGVAWARSIARTSVVAASLSLAIPLVTASASRSVPAAAAGRHVASAYAGRYIVEGASIATLRADVAGAGGRWVGTLPVVHGAVAQLDTAAASRLAAVGGVALTPDEHVAVESTNAPATSGPVENFPEVTGATQLWSAGDTGQGVTVAVLDTGIDAALPDFGGRVIDGVDLTGGNSPYTDGYGHGTFVAGLVGSDGASSGGTYTGEAPGANLVSIKVADAAGDTSESTVIQGIAWAIQHRGAPDDIRVLNLSLGVPPSGPAATDPLDQAVEAAWQAGIVVVTSAGNDGPTSGSITSPGDDPLVVTVGALDTTAGAASSDWAIPSWSSVGPASYGGEFKPDVVAPGASVVSLADPGSTVYDANPSAVVGSANFVGSGTSFSAAITSGEAALLLEQDPQATPDEIKGALLASAQPGPVDNPFVEGHGVTDVAAAAQVQGPSLDQSGFTGYRPGDGPYELGSAWAVSTWNPANWAGTAWDGQAWDGQAWDGQAWDGQAWDGQAWDGQAWDGQAWDGQAWDGQAWDGQAWDGQAWDGQAWDGQAWDSTMWDGQAWDEASWTSAAWNQDSWG